MITPMEERIGSMTKLFDKSSITIVKLEFGDTVVGDTLRIKGNNSDFQKVGMMEFDCQPVQKASPSESSSPRLSSL